MKDNFCTIYLVRHGESEANITGIVGGDTPLTQKGKKQALRLGEKLTDVNFSAVFSSNLKRAKQTAEYIVQGRQFEIQIHKGLRERSFGSIDSDKDEKYKYLFEALKDMSDEEFWEWKIVDDMENAQEAVGRFIKALKEISKSYLGKEILVVSHGTVMRTLLVKLGRGTFRDFPSGALENTAYIKLKSDGENFTIEEVSGLKKLNGLSL